MRLTEDAEPELSSSTESFQEQVESGEYWGIPIRFFDTSGDHVTLDSRLAKKLEWNIDAERGNKVNINAPAQRVFIDGEQLDINPGFFCSYVSTDQLKKE